MEIYHEPGLSPWQRLDKANCAAPSPRREVILETYSQVVQEPISMLMIIKNSTLWLSVLRPYQ